MIKIENQLDKKWKPYYLGEVKTSSFNNYACHLFCWTYIYSVKLNRQISPDEVDRIFMHDKVYYGDMIDSVKAAKSLGLQYFGKEYNINKPPKWWPSIKEVDFSIKNGKQQHFVVRTKDENGNNIILDPYGGLQRSINHYEKKVSATGWQGGHFSYRLVKI